MIQNKIDSVNELIADVLHIAKLEWDSRTTYGKILYPVWFIYCTLLWISFFVMILPAAIAKFLVELTSESSSERKLLPDIYKNEEKE